MLREPDHLVRSLSEIVGEEHTLTGAATARFAVDGMQPRVAVRPASQEQVEAVAAACSASRAAMVPWGGGTGIGIGNPPSRLDVLVCLDRLTRIVEFDDANLNVTAEAGVRLADLQAVLNGKQEFLPLDPAQADQVTVGGLLQTNASGPSRLLYGSARDWVLGLRVVLPSGERIRCGGKVIKNVSGYDMNKVFIGSLGTLGIVTEATFKLLPLPAMRATVVGVFARLSDVAAVVNRTLESFLLPEAMEALDPHALTAVGPALGLATASGYGLVIGLAGSAETVERQVRDFNTFFAQGNALTTATLGADQEAAAWQAVREVQARISGERVVVKIAVPIGKTLELFSAADGLLQRLQWRGAITAHAGSGIVRAGFGANANESLEALRDGLVALRREAEASEGSLVLEAAPLALKRSLDAWGTAREGSSVMRRLKAQFDPQGLMNPGRFLVGI
jgi:glycolate oxidase FAD binding subunit